MGNVTAPLAWDFLGCAGVLGNINVEAEKAARLTPPGLTARRTGPITIVGFTVLDCEGVVLDNRTVLGRTWFAWTAIPVVPPGPEHQQSSNLFLAAAYSDRPEVVSRFRAAGFEATLAAFDGNEDPLGPDVLVTTGQESVRMRSILSTEPDDIEFVIRDRYHDGAGGVMDLSSLQTSGMVLSALLEAQGGYWDALVDPVAQEPALGAEIAGTYRFEAVL